MNVKVLILTKGMPLVLYKTYKVLFETKTHYVIFENNIYCEIFKSSAEIMEELKELDNGQLLFNI